MTPPRSSGCSSRLIDCIAQVLDAHQTPPEQIGLDLDATDDPLHGSQEGRFFHGYYGCYCYLPLYLFCGDHLLAAKLRRSSIDASAGAVAEVERIVSQIRASWPQVRIILRADSGFAREALMSWCEANRVDYVLGLARNSRLVDEIAAELAAARTEAEQTGQAARCYKEFHYRTRDTWSRERRVVGPSRAPARARFADRIERLLTLDGRAARRRSLGGAAALRAALLCPRRDGEPDQGVPARPVRGPDVHANDALQPAPPG
jgi:hypothetical protein